MEATKKVASFVKQFAAVLTGDSATAQAQKALRQADSALQTQIASLVGDTIVKEDAVTTAKEYQASARINNGCSITDRTSYVGNLLTTKNRVTDAEEALALHLAKIDFLKGELVALTEEVDA